MKKIALSLCMLLGMLTGMQAEVLPISGGWHYTVVSTGGVTVKFTKQWGEIGICNKLPISLDDYKGFRIEFASKVTDLQVKVQNATDAADKDTYPGQYVSVAEGGDTKIAADFNKDRFGSDKQITVMNLQYKGSSSASVTISRVVLIKSNGTEVETRCDTNVGYNREVTTEAGGESIIVFDQQWGQVGGSNWSNSSADAKDTYTITFGEDIGEGVLQWKYTNADGDHYVDIKGTKAELTIEGAYTACCFQLKKSIAAGETYEIKVVSIERTSGSTGGNTGGGGGGGDDPLPTDGDLLPITIVQDASIEVGQVANVTFTQQYGEMNVCKDLPFSIDTYKGVKIEFTEPVTSNIQLKIQNATDQADKDTYPAQYLKAEDGAMVLEGDFKTEHFGSDKMITVMNLQSTVADEKVCLKRVALVKHDGTEVPVSYDTSIGYHFDIEAYQGYVTFKKQYAKIGGWVNEDPECDDLYTITFAETIPAETFQWVYTDTRSHYPEIKTATDVMTLEIKGTAYTNCCLQYKGNGEATYYIKSITVQRKHTATGIRSIDNGQQTIDNAYYDLSGRRIDNPTKKGVYIKNGKKFIVK